MKRAAILLAVLAIASGCATVRTVYVEVPVVVYQPAPVPPVVEQASYPGLPADATPDAAVLILWDALRVAVLRAAYLEDLLDSYRVTSEEWAAAHPNRE